MRLPKSMLEHWPSTSHEEFGQQSTASLDCAGQGVSRSRRLTSFLECSKHSRTPATGQHLLLRCTNMSLITQLEKETRVLRARDVAKLFQVTPQHVYKMAAGGRLPSFRLAGAIRFDPHELANWLRKAQPVPYRPEDGNQLRRSA